MSYSKIFSAVTFTFLLGTALSSQTHSASENAYCTIPEGAVQSANIMFIRKDPGTNEFSALIGRSNTRTTVLEFPGGHCEKKDPDAYRTAAREANEETGGHVHIDPEELKTAPYIVALPEHGNRVIFIVRKDDLDVMAINKTIGNTLKNHEDRHFKEVHNYVWFPLKELLKTIDSQKSKIVATKGKTGKRRGQLHLENQGANLKPNLSMTLSTQEQRLNEILTDITGE